MTEKDVVSKTLESYPDVFADIINGFLFGGKQLVSPDDLIPANIASQYKSDNKMCPNESYQSNASIEALKESFL